MSDSNIATATTAEPAGVPFFRNWVFWTSLVAAIPGATVAAFIVLGAKDNGGEFNWMMALVTIVTFLCAAAAAVLPILLALGFFMGDTTIAAALPESSADEEEFESEDAFGEPEDADAFDGEEDDFDFEDDENFGLDE